MGYILFFLALMLLPLLRVLAFIFIAKKVQPSLVDNEVECGLHTPTTIHTTTANI